MAQPYLHEHLICVAAPSTWLSRASGQVVDGVDGLYVNDRRLLSRLVVTVDGREPEPLSARMMGARIAVFLGVLRELGDGGPDPTVILSRRREVVPDGGIEELTLVNHARSAVSALVEVSVGTDLAPMGLVKSGMPGPARDDVDVAVTADPPPERGEAGRLAWRVTVPPRSSWTVTLRVTRSDASPHAAADESSHAAADASSRAVTDASSRAAAGALAGAAANPPVVAAADASSRAASGASARAVANPPPVAVTDPPSTLRVAAADRRLDELIRRSVEDLDALRMRDGSDVFYAAGSPWYLTLFGRDSLWSARLALPLGWEVAAGTLRVLARRQGTRVDPHAEEEPGKILHEVRPPDAATDLAPVYYGSVDATALFVSVLAEAYRWGMPAADVAALLPAVERAMAWLTAHDDFVAYRPTGHGLTNQGWKDSHDGVQFADGRIAVAPLSLSEVQGYAYQAAIDGAGLVESLGGGPLAQAWRSWAKALAERFRAAFWCTDAGRPYPAIALDGAGHRVDGPASNMGHLLGTGLLDARESAAVTGWLSAPELAAPFGLRTLATTAAGYNPISYHAGSVWPHDTVIAILGLVREGQPAAAARHIVALLDAAYRFDFRLPELFAGDEVPTPYPPACRPQAWAAAVGPAIVTALLGLRADAPAGQLTLDPIAPSPVGAFEVRGLRVAGGTLDVDVAADGHPTVLAAPLDVTLHPDRR